MLVMIACTAMVQPEKPGNNKHGGFAVLELFTSEGCSSCPPADELLARIQQEADDSVYILVYHVDYWNRSGWKDVFSKPGYSSRQYMYNKLFTSQVYTPQLIINGKTEHVGGDESNILYDMKKVLGEPASASLKIVMRDREHLDYETVNTTPEDRLVVAIVQKQGITAVKGGENKGRTLSHVQIVRDLFQFNPGHGKGTVSIQLPKDFNTDSWELIAMIQDTRTGLMKAAGRTSKVCNIVAHEQEVN